MFRDSRAVAQLVAREFRVLQVASSSLASPTSLPLMLGGSSAGKTEPEWVTPIQTASETWVWLRMHRKRRVW